ncbi:similar to Saccharomyces cerevisiae YBR102C EXO84 Essential protein with dual roles in spliceosome assembly and exocytosis [Maudiozyma saulgeensis]|uniref:Exocyst complex component EXO84 n=1 Tax=Maudiozyma saulgeensis TaxID=1789683 RepID=A0A1X7RBH6_9SACH|nr:similar to Saccharomyces cerevisiae YBR102C EXO84 Essential protein with dual roles in spliceosome assembly and exocytosis [Kazachstania saulgeensis]
MVEISLRKARNNWKNVTGGSPTKNKSKTTESQELTSVRYENTTEDVSKKNKKDKKGKKNKAGTSPYSNMDTSYTELPTINAREKNKAASSMQRRLSVHTQNYIPPTLDYSMPLPMSALNGLKDGNMSVTTLGSATDLNGRPMYSTGNNNSTMSHDLAKQAASTQTTAISQASRGEPITDLLQVSVLKNILSDPQFNTKQFVHERLGNASAVDIDAFTTTLTMLSDRVQIDVKQNLNKSYNEILQVNDGLYVASNELKTLRKNFKQLADVVEEFDASARKRLTLEQEAESQRKNQSLLPPVSGVQKQKRDRSSVLVLDKIWKDELVKLVDTVEGSKNVIFEGGERNVERHIILKSNDWVELNVTTMRFLQIVTLYILNDLIIVASRNKNNDLMLNQCLDLKTINVMKEPDSNRILLKPDSRINETNIVNGINMRNGTTNRNIGSNGLLYETRDEKECLAVLDAIRKAKDALCDIFQTEVENERKIKESFRYLQSTQQTPSGDKYNTRSPVKGNRRSVGVSMTPKRNSRHTSMTPGPNISSTTDNGVATGIASSTSGVSTIVNSFMDQNLLQSLTLSMHSNSLGNDSSSIPGQLKSLDDSIEEVDVQIARLKFSEAVDSLSAIEDKINQLYANVNGNPHSREDSTSDTYKGDISMLYNLLILKINQRRDTIGNKITQSVLFDSEISHLLGNVIILSKLGMKEQSLDLFLQNRSTVIQKLTLQIGSFDNPVNYLTQLAVVRFQTIKQTILNFEKVFPEFSNKNALDNKFSSILVNWCSSEVDKHFQLIDKQLLNDEMLSPASIKSTRKQIDDLKSVGLDFVYKLDDFIRKNSHKIR